MGVDQCELALPFERPLSGQALVEHAAERVDVGTAVDIATVDLLGWDVVERPDQASVPRQAARRGQVPGEAEVAEIRMLAFRALLR